jgi:hypothetical protein
LCTDIYRDFWRFFLEIEMEIYGLNGKQWCRVDKQTSKTLTFAFELGVPGVVPPGMMVGSPIVGWVVAPFVTEIGLNDVTDDWKEAR